MLSERLIKRLQEREAELVRELTTCRQDIADAMGEDVGKSLVEPASKAIKEIPPLRWHVNGLFHSVGFGAIGSAPFVGKTYIASHIAGSLSAGRPIFGHFHPTQPIRVLYLYGESNRSEFLWTMKKTLESRGIDGKNLFVKADRIPASQMKVGMPALEAAIKSVGAKFVVLDTLAFFNPTGESNDDLQPKLIEPTVELAERQQCFILFVHHAQKATAGVDGIYQFRGGTALSGAADVLLRVERLKNHAKDSKHRTLIIEKVRGAPGGEMELEFDFGRKVVYEVGQDPREVIWPPDKYAAAKANDPWPGEA